jgi:hypothetical protein
VPVLGGGTARNELGSASYLHEPGRSGEAVAGDVGDRRIERRQRASAGIVGQQPVADRAEQVV